MVLISMDTLINLQGDNMSNAMNTDQQWKDAGYEETGVKSIPGWLPCDESDPDRDQLVGGVWYKQMQGEQSLEYAIASSVISYATYIVAQMREQLLKANNNAEVIAIVDEYYKKLSTGDTAEL